MKLIIKALALLAAFASPAHSQIYADVAISQGGTSLGTIRITLEHTKAPRSVANFIGLASGQRPWVNPTTGKVMIGVPYYDGQIFHRLIHNFVIQGGDPTGTGSGGPGFVVQDEFDPTLRHTGRYMLSSAKTASPNTTGSQFFITLEAAGHLDDKHSIFGIVTGGQSIIDDFTDSTLFPTNASDGPITPITMDTVTISGPDYASFDINDPALRLPHVKGQPLCLDYDASTSNVNLTYPRAAQYNYLSYYSLDLTTWTKFRYSLSLDSDPANIFTITGVNLPKFFVCHAAIDYTQVYNPPADLLANGSVLTLCSPTGDCVTLTSNGAGAGTWTDTNGGSGSLTAFTLADSAPDSGYFTSTGDQAHFIPLMSMNVQFDSPAGASAWSTLTGTISFHSPTHGGFEGTVNQPFTFTP